jgi:Asp-tRNA(Asn)/Glu-tRNA(Gln) amidotransferase A subunit family amidase
MKEVQTEDSPIVESYLKAGAIPLVRGNVAMGAMSIHTKNLVFGESLNPYNTSRSCGGSSGGDAGLVAARCIPLGIGIDIGGSVRIPAAFTGVYGFKPSQGRVSSRGVSASQKTFILKNQIFILSAAL